MAEEEKEEVKKKKGLPPGILKFVALGIGGLFLIIAAGAVAFLVAKSVKPPKLEFHPEKEEVAIVKEYHHYDIGEEEPFITHLADPDEPHLIKAKLILAHDPRYKRLPMELAKKKFQIRDIINTTLISKTSKELSTVEGKKALEAELITKINQILTTGKIERIFMEYVVQ